MAISGVCSNRAHDKVTPLATPRFNQRRADRSRSGQPLPRSAIIYASLTSTGLAGLGSHFLREIEAFFTTYKLLEPKNTSVLSSYDVAAALEVIRTCREGFQALGSAD